MSNENCLPDYVREQVEKIAKVTGFSEYRFEQDVGSNHAEGFMATMLKITVIGLRSASDGTVRPDQLDLICKMLPSGKARREMFSGVQAFEREVEMYNQILPLFAKFQTDKGLTKANGFFDFPHCYYAIANAVQDRYLIVMDDLRPIGYQLWDKLKPIEYDNVRLLMTALGRLHGISFAMRDQRPNVFASLQLKNDIFMHMLLNSNAMVDINQAGLDVAIRAFEGRPELEFLKRQKIFWKDDYLAILENQHLERFSVVCHGDCWNNNFMFLSRQNKVDEIRLLDWQLSRLGSPALDLGYFLMTSTNKNLRDKHLDDFLQIYYTQLAATVRKCGSDPDRLFTFVDLQNELKRNGRFGVNIAPVFLQIIISKPDDIKSMDTLAEGDASQSKEFATLDSATKAVYVQRLADVINDAKAYGWLD